MTDVFLSYFGLAVLYALGVLAGFILLIIPAFFLIARWSLAQPLVVVRGDGIRQAFGESWERTKGNEFQIIVAVFVLVILPQAVSVTTVDVPQGECARHRRWANRDERRERGIGCHGRGAIRNDHWRAETAAPSNDGDAHRHLTRAARCHHPRAYVYV